jgi:hypothetical protein
MSTILLISMLTALAGGVPDPGGLGGKEQALSQPVDSVTGQSTQPGLSAGWLPGRHVDGSVASLLPSWISGILDSPVLQTPVRLRFSRSGFMLGYRFSFSL